MASIISSLNNLKECIEKLWDQAKPTADDYRYAKYVKYVNAFLKHFGEERVYLVGSTGEGTKNEEHVDKGDVDCLIVSGEAVPVDCLEFKPECPSYTWVRGDRIPECEQFDLLDGVYLDANLLRDVTPHLFSIARGGYLYISANLDRVKAAVARDDVTTLGIRSKVGLSHTTYRGVEIHGNLEKYRSIRLQENMPTKLKPNRILELVTSQLHPDDSRIIKRAYELTKKLRRVLETTQIAKRPEDHDTFHGHFAFFATLLEEAIEETETVTDCYSKSEDVEPEPAQQRSNLDIDEKAITDIRLVYTQIEHRDFVPSLRIIGQLECMDKWRERVTDAGFDRDTVDDVYNTDCFLISRESLINPDKSKDFYIAFGLHEQKILKRFSDTQKMTYLMLKTLRKGILDLQSGDNRLRTYHIKTTAFWRFEEELKSSENEECSAADTFQRLNNALKLLKNSIENKTLKHYFTCGNLFANYKDNDFRVISDTLDEVLDSPLTSVMKAFELSEKPVEGIPLLKGEVNRLLNIEVDGGKEENINRLREAACDVINGVSNAKRRQEDGNSYLKDALLELARLFLEDEITDQKENRFNIEESITLFEQYLTCSEEEKYKIRINLMGTVGGIFL